jgi:hypothetical protein
VARWAADLEANMGDVNMSPVDAAWVARICAARQMVVATGDVADLRAAIYELTRVDRNHGANADAVLAAVYASAPSTPPTLEEVLSDLAASREPVRVAVTFNDQVLIGTVVRVSPGVEGAGDVRGRPQGGFDLHVGSVRKPTVYDLNLDNIRVIWRASGDRPILFQRDPPP